MFVIGTFYLSRCAIAMDVRQTAEMCAAALSRWLVGYGVGLVTPVIAVLDVAARPGL